MKRPTTQVSRSATTHAVVEEDDVPAIQRQQADAPAINAASSAGASRPTPMSIQDYLKNQQRK